MELEYELYKLARNMAWKVLRDCKITVLPLDLMKIIKFYDFRIIPYSKSDYVKSLNAEIQNEDGFSRMVEGQKAIYFNDNVKSKERIRFTVAHELGHCVMNHNLANIKYRNYEIDNPDDSIEEMQANVFARDILMPAIVLHYTNCCTYADIMRLCSVSEASAKIRAERMGVLKKRNKFGLNYLERQVHNQFKDFINIIVNK